MIWMSYFTGKLSAILRILIRQKFSSTYKLLLVCGLCAYLVLIFVHKVTRKAICGNQMPNQLKCVHSDACEHCCCAEMHMHID